MKKLIIALFLFSFMAVNNSYAQEQTELKLNREEVLELRVADYQVKELQTKFKAIQEEIQGKIYNIYGKKKIVLKRTEERLGVELKDYDISGEGILSKKEISE